MELLNWLTAESFQLALGAWGSGLSTWLGIRELRKRKLNLSTTYSFYGTDQIDDEITIVNLSPVPLFVSHWSLVWEPTWPPKRECLDITPDDASAFKVEGQDDFSLSFGGVDSLPWGHEVAKKRKLVLTLHIHGRRRPKRLTIMRG